MASRRTSLDRWYDCNVGSRLYAHLTTIFVSSPNPPLDWIFCECSHPKRHWAMTRLPLGNLHPSADIFKGPTRLSKCIAVRKGLPATSHHFRWSSHGKILCWMCVLPKWYTDNSNGDLGIRVPMPDSLILISSCFPRLAAFGLLHLLNDLARADSL